MCSVDRSDSGIDEQNGAPMRTKARKIMPRTRPVTAEPATEFTAELATTLATLTLFHSAVQHADDKARTIVAIQTPGYNQFAFPNVANDFSPVRVSVREQCAQAREVGRVLANLAMVKHRYIRRAMYGTCALFASALGSLVLTVVS
jgi:hypothetical protein